MRTTIPCLLWILPSLVFASPSRAALPQEDAAPTPGELAQLERVLQERNREDLHEGDPLVLSGLDQGVRGFRARTPILLQSEGSLALVDPEENHARRLALYESGASFRSPLAVQGRAATGVADEVAPPGPRASQATEPPVAGRALWPAGLFVAFCAALGGFLGLRYANRRRGMAERGATLLR